MESSTTALQKMTPLQRKRGEGKALSPYPAGMLDTADNLRPQGYLGNALRTWPANASSDVEPTLALGRDLRSSEQIPLQVGTG